MTGQALLEGALREPAMVEHAEFCGLATERLDERERGGDHVGNESEPQRARDLQSVLEFALDRLEWISYGEKTRSEIPAGVGSIRRVSLLVRHIKGTTRRVDTLFNRPG